MDPPSFIPNTVSSAVASMGNLNNTVIVEQGRRVTPKSKLNTREYQTLQKLPSPTSSSSTAGLHTQPLNAAGLVNSLIQEISRCQFQMSRNECKLEDSREKLRKFEELAELLRTASPTTRILIILTPLLKKLGDECLILEKKVEQDIKRLSEAWEEALNIFLRAICQQFDKEVEAGTEFLYQEARVFFNTLSRNYVASGQRCAETPASSTHSLRHPGEISGSEESLKGTMCFQHQFIINDMHRQATDFVEKLSGMQEQLARQSERIEFLLQQNELMQNIHGRNTVFPHFSL